MRPKLVVVAVLALVLPSTSVFAAEPPSGAITCASVVGMLEYDKFLPTVVAQDLNGYSKPIRVKLNNATGLCDASGVLGGSHPIANVSFDLKGRLPAGSDCADMTGTPPFDKTKLAADWKSASGAMVGRSKATLASVSYDSNTDQLVFVTNPIVRGAFVGSTLTFRMGFTQPDYDDYCTTVDVLFGGHFVGPSEPAPNSGPSSVSVP